MYKWIKLLSIQIKTKNTHNLVFQLHPPIQIREEKYKKGIRKADSTALRTWWPGWCHIPEAWAGFGPMTGGPQCRWSWEHVPGNVTPQWTWGASSLCMSTQSPDAGGTSFRENKPISPKNWWSLQAGTGLQGPLATLCPLGWGSYLQPPSLGSLHLQTTAPSAEWCPQTGMCPEHPG